MGFRYRVNEKPIREVNRKADILFRKKKLAIFVDGCFWHVCPEHGTWPKANSEFWSNKILENKKRDEETNRILLSNGWKVIRIWEHENPDDAVSKISSVLLETKC